MKQVLAISGLDPSGCSGLLRDVKTIDRLGCFAMGVITANTCQSVNKSKSIISVESDYLNDQFDHLLATERIDACKVGVLYDVKTMEVVKYYLDCLSNIVVDPVLYATSGLDLIQKSAMFKYDEILKKASLVTPNKSEIKVLTNSNTIEANILVKRFYEKYGVSCLLKDAFFETKKGYDLFYDGKRSVLFEPKNLLDAEVRGTGCCLSSSIATYLALDFDILKAVEKSKLKLEEWRQKSIRGRM